MKPIKTLLVRLLVSLLRRAKEAIRSTWPGEQSVTDVASPTRWRVTLFKAQKMRSCKVDWNLRWQWGYQPAVQTQELTRLFSNPRCVRSADFVGALKKIACISCAIARLWYAKGIETGVLCFWGLAVWNTWGWTP
jgi:hypothetical protein